MRRELLRLQRQLGLTTIFVTHDQEQANTTSDRMAVLDGGVIQQVGTPQELYDQPSNLFVANFLGTANILEGHVETDGDQARFVTKYRRCFEPSAGRNRQKYRAQTAEHLHPAAKLGKRAAWKNPPLRVPRQPGSLPYRRLRSGTGGGPNSWRRPRMV